MMQYRSVYALLLLFVVCTYVNGQNKDNSKPQTKAVVNYSGPSSIVRNIIQDRKGDVWMASWEGAFRYDGKSFTNMTRGVTSARFFSLVEDRKGNLWFGTIGSGVFRYDGISFQNFTTDNGLLNNEVVCIYEDNHGDIWFGTYGGASRYDGKSFRHYIINGDSMREDRTGKTFPNSPRQPYEVNAIIEDETGKVWLGTRGNSFVYDGKKFTTVARAGDAFRNVRTIIEDRKGNIWLGGNNGLWRYDGSTFTNFTYTFVGYIYEDSAGNIWTSSGGVTGDWVLSRYSEKSLTNNDVAQPQIIKSKEGMIFGILEANDGSIWLGTLDGVRRYDGNTFDDFKSKVKR
jgi:ligand-binding sensor domain-containing protein